MIEDQLHECVLFGLCWTGIKLECATVGLELKNHPQPATLYKLAELVLPIMVPVNKRADNATGGYVGIFHLAFS